MMIYIFLFSENFLKILKRFNGYWQVDNLQIIFIYKFFYRKSRIFLPVIKQTSVY